MSATELHELPYGSVIAADQVVALRGYDGPSPWSLTDARGRYTVGHLLAMSQDWTVLRLGRGRTEGR